MKLGESLFNRNISLGENRSTLEENQSTCVGSRGLILGAFAGGFAGFIGGTAYGDSLDQQAIEKLPVDKVTLRAYDKPKTVFKNIATRTYRDINTEATEVHNLAAIVVDKDSNGNIIYIKNPAREVSGHGKAIVGERTNYVRDYTDPNPAHELDNGKYVKIPWEEPTVEFETGIKKGESAFIYSIVGAIAGAFSGALIAISLGSLSGK